MTANQTIDGVPREHIAAWAERLERANSGFPGSVPFLQELRALLDAPVQATGNLGIEMMRCVGDSDSGPRTRLGGGNFPPGVRVDSFSLSGGYAEAVAALKAAQGEPVAWLFESPKNLEAYRPSPG